MVTVSPPFSNPYNHNYYIKPTGLERPSSLYEEGDSSMRLIQEVVSLILEIFSKKSFESHRRSTTLENEYKLNTDEVARLMGKKGTQQLIITLVSFAFQVGGGLIPNQTLSELAKAGATMFPQFGEFLKNPTEVDLTKANLDSQFLYQKLTDISQEKSSDSSMKDAVTKLIQSVVEEYVSAARR